jgi:hypothetical protein
MPQIGQLPGAARTISGCIGHVYFLPDGSIAAVALALESGDAALELGDAGAEPGAPGRAADTYRAGSATNFARQPAEQKR